VDLVDSRLIAFIRNETKEEALADRLEYLIQQKAGLAEMVVTILKYVDYYSMGEIEEIRGILEMLNTKNVNERLKARADSYLLNQCFYSAIKNYDKIISGDRDSDLTGLFYAKVYHNMGVAYARLFFYRQAVCFFEEAYKIGQHEESKKCSMAAAYMARGQNVIENDDATQEEYVLKREIETLMDNARYSDEYRHLQAVGNLKEQGLVTEYYHEIDDIMKMWKLNYMKYTS
jgi:tetratricopeptide (TPR) repeat protein